MRAERGHESSLDHADQRIRGTLIQLQDDISGEALADDNVRTVVRDLSGFDAAGEIDAGACF